MNKPESLREHLLASVPDLRRNADRLLIFVEQGSVRSTLHYSLSFEYSYDLKIIITDFGGGPDAVFLPLLVWLQIHQPDLQANLEKARDAIQFEAEILGKTVDFAITIPLTERVIVKNVDGVQTVTHAAEPQLEEQLDITSLQILLADGTLLDTWS